MGGRLNVFLIVSFALNLLLLGLLLGQTLSVVSHQHDAPTPPATTTKEAAHAVDHHRIHFAETPVAAVLPPEKFKRFEQEMHAIFEAHHAYRETQRAGYERLLNLLAAPTLDAEAYEEEVDRLTEMKENEAERMMLGTFAAVKDFTQAEREAVAETIRAHRAKYRDHKHS